MPPIRTVLRQLPAIMILSALIPATAQAQNPSMDGLITFGGQMHALAELCGDYTAAELTQMKADQKDQAARNGVSAADFEKTFKTGYDEGAKALASAPPEQKKQACEQARAMKNMQLPGVN